MDNGTFPTGTKPGIKIGNDPKHGELFISPAALEFEAQVARFNDVPVKSSQGAQKGASNVSGVAILLAPGTAN